MRNATPTPSELSHVLLTEKKVKFPFGVGFHAMYFFVVRTANFENEDWSSFSSLKYIHVSSTNSLSVRRKKSHNEQKFTARKFSFVLNVLVVMSS